MQISLTIFSLLPPPFLLPETFLSLQHPHQANILIIPISQLSMDGHWGEEAELDRVGAQTYWVQLRACIQMAGLGMVNML